jgi:MFS family permease
MDRPVQSLTDQPEKGHVRIESGRRPGAFKGPVWYPMALLSACYLLANIDRNIFGLLVEPIKAAFRMSDAQIGFLQGTAFSVFVLLGAVPLSRLADRGDRPTILGLCTLVWSVATSACGFATSWLGLFVARSAVAVGEGGLPPAALSFFPDIYRGAALVRANAVLLFAVYLGGGLGLLVGGDIYASAQHWRLAGTPLAGLAPWQLVFVVVGLPGLVLGPLALLTLREPPDIHRIRPPKPYGLLDTVKYMISRPTFQGLFIATACASTLLAFTNLAWIPAMLMRNFKMGARDVGLTYGPLFTIAGLLGAAIAAELGGRFGAADEPRLRRMLRLLLVEAVLLVVPSVLAPLATSVPAALALLTTSIFLYSGMLVLVASASQIVYPTGMRAQASTIASVVNGLVGAGAGPLLVGLVSDALPSGPRSLSSALSIVAAIVAPLIVLTVWGMGRVARRNPEMVLPPSVTHPKGELGTAS